MFGYENTYRRVAIGALALGFALPVFAGTATIMNGKDATAIEYASNKLRMETDGDGYMVIRDGRMYMVTGNTVMDASSMMRMFGGSMPAPGPNAGKIESLSSTGRSETVAGIRGEVWEMTYTDDEGKRKSTDLVLSRDPKAREFQSAMGLMTETLLSAAGKDPQGAQVMIKEFEKRQRGMLRFGKEFQVSAISDRSVSDARFSLPSEPVQVPGFGGAPSGNTKAASDGSSDGGFGALGGLFGKKADRQKDRIEDRTENEVDEATDTAVDKALNKAFDKLFGN